jgi:hypothetical protein
MDVICVSSVAISNRTPDKCGDCNILFLTNAISEVVITTIAPHGNAALPFVIPSSLLACGK